MNDTVLTLLSTEHCTLCDQAMDMLLSMPELRGRPMRVVDVAEDDRLLDAYGPRLPVLRVHGRELDWPFDAGQVLAALQPDARRS